VEGSIFSSSIKVSLKRGKPSELKYDIKNKKGSRVPGKSGIPLEGFAESSQRKGQNWGNEGSEHRKEEEGGVLGRRQKSEEENEDIAKSAEL